MINLFTIGKRLSTIEKNQETLMTDLEKLQTALDQLSIQMDDTKANLEASDATIAKIADDTSRSLEAIADLQIQLAALPTIIPLSVFDTLGSLKTTVESIKTGVESRNAVLDGIDAEVPEPTN